MTDTYINMINKRTKKNNDRQLYYFGYGFGTFLFLISIFKFLTNSVNYELDKVYITFAVIGILLVLITVVYPKLLYYPQKGMRGLINFIGGLIFKILLTVIYFIIVTPVGLILQKKQPKLVDSTFVNKKQDSNTNKNMKKKSMIYQIGKIFSFVINENSVILIPILVVLVLLGLLLVFVQSSAVAPFIYTLF